ncbi:MAG: hypothetical protein AAFW82_09665 [Pseudomonadota bacterium]
MTKISILQSILMRLLLCLTIFLSACSTTTRIAVPTGLTNSVQVKGFKQIRMWGDEALPDIEQLVAQRIQQTKEKRPQLFRKRTVGAAT